MELAERESILMYFLCFISFPFMIEALRTFAADRYHVKHVTVSKPGSSGQVAGAEDEMSDKEPMLGQQPSAPPPYGGSQPRK